MGHDGSGGVSSSARRVAVQGSKEIHSLRSEMQSEFGMITPAWAERKSEFSG